MRALVGTIFTVGIALGLAACGRSEHPPERKTQPVIYGDPTFEGDASDHKYGGEAIPTYYYKPLIDLAKDRCSGTSRIAMIDKTGKVLVTLCPSDYANCLMQGSCWVKSTGNTKSYTYHSKVDNRHRFFESDMNKCPTGYGAGGRCLKPFYSVAADPKLYSMGSVIYLPKVKGAKLPDGSFHSGYFVVLDTGGNIKGPGRFDFYTGPYNRMSKGNVFIDLGLSDKKKRFSFYNVYGKTAEAVRRNANNIKPKLDFWSTYRLM
ncbi:MAG: 3D domain-containing protein [Pseudobdellovibrionaceae bacterium]